MNLRSLKIGIAVLLFFLFTAVGHQPAYAVDGTRVFIWFLFFSGVGSSTAGAIIQGQANETYDKYMHTAAQSDMQKFVKDYKQKHRQSIIASRTGMGLTISAILLSLIDASHIPPPEARKDAGTSGFEYRSPDDRIASMSAQNGEITFAVGHKF